MEIQCHDRMSGERFAVPAADDAGVEAAIEGYIWLGIDADTGPVGYDVVTDDGRHFSGTVDPLESPDA